MGNGFFADGNVIDWNVHCTLVYCACLYTKSRTLMSFVMAAFTVNKQIFLNTNFIHLKNSNKNVELLFPELFDRLFEFHTYSQKC